MAALSRMGGWRWERDERGVEDGRYRRRVVQGQWWVDIFLLAGR